MWAALFGGEEAPSSTNTESKAQESSAEEDGNSSPLSLLLNRMNELLVQIGELQFEKKKIVEQANLESSVFRSQILSLENKMQELENRNQELEFACEASSENIMADQLQDLCDMRDALLIVRDQLEQELEIKNNKLSESYLVIRKRTELFEMYSEDIRSLILSIEAALSHYCQTHDIRLQGIMCTIHQIIELERKAADDKKSADAGKDALWEAEARSQADTIRRLEHQLASKSSQMIAEMDSIKSSNHSVVNELKSELATCEVDLQRSKEELLTQKNETVRLKRAIDKTREDVAVILSSEASVSYQYADTSKDDDALSDWLKDVESQLKSQVHSAEAELSHLLASNAQVKSENVILKNKIDALMDAAAREIKSSSALLAEELLLSILGVLRSTQGSEYTNNDAELDKDVASKISSRGRKLLKDVISAHRDDLDRLKHMQAMVVGKDQEISNLRNTCDDVEILTKKVTTLEGELKALHMERDSAVGECADSKNRLAMLCEENKELELRNSKLRVEYDTLRANNDDLLHQLNIKEQELVSRSNFMDSTISDHEKARAETLDYIRKLENDHSSTLQELADVSAALQVFQKSSDESKLKLESALRREKQTVLAMEDQNSSLSERCCFLERERTIMIAQIQEFNKKLEDTTAYYEATNVSKEALQKEIEDLGNQIRVYQAKISDLEASSENLKKSNIDTIAKYEAAVHDIRAAEHDAAQARAAKLEAENRLVLLEQQLTEKLDCMHNIQQELETVKIEKLQYWDQLQETGKRLKDMTTEANDVKATCTTLKHAALKYQSELTQIEQETQNFRQQTSKEIDHLKCQNSTLLAELEKFVESRNELDTQMTVMRQKHETLKTERNVLAARSRELEELLSQYTEIPCQHDPTKLLAPDLWELLYKGMEQLKIDLEVASKHAACIDDDNEDIPD